ncbi:MAG: 2-isopropylmalate synthase [Candidatus Micrarchaeota archaeon]|nr:2-isopropylmalate synthase [Candidatus Micrarchaeota archaeon]
MNEKVRQVRIFDTTLRDGEQTPGVALKPVHKLQIARRLDALGVDSIEAGFPIISDGEREAIRSIAKEGLRAEVFGLARANKGDIDAAIGVGLKYVHTFIATSDIHLNYKLKITREQALDKAIDAVQYAKSMGLIVEFSAEDATRTDRAFLKKVYGAVAGAGADRIDIPDTVGYSTPFYIAEITRDAIEATGLPISVHCHNDFGLAVANAISGIQAGASCAHVTINGIGERAGNASLEELVMAIQSLNFGETKYVTNINTRLLYDASQFVSKLTGMKVQANKAVVGDNAFAHESGIHTHGVLSNPLTYEAISPESVGRKTVIVPGKHSGAHGIYAELAGYGISPNKEQVKAILDEVKGIGDRGGHVTDVDLLSIAQRVMRTQEFATLVRLEGFSGATGIGTMPYAFVKLEIEGKEYKETAYGNGPVDAALKAMQKAIGKRAHVNLKDYKLEAISGGSDSQCEVTVVVEDKFGNEAHGKMKGEDITITSVNAMLQAINWLMIKDMINRRRGG